MQLADKRLNNAERKLLLQTLFLQEHICVSVPLSSLRTKPPLMFRLISERYYWDSKLRIPTADYQEVLHDDKAALAWLLALRRVGIVYLKGAPGEKGQVARLADRIGYLRLTFYG